MGQSTTVIPTGGGGAKVQDSIPTNPQKGDFWVDTSVVPEITKWYNGTDFVPVIQEVNSTEHRINTDVSSSSSKTILQNYHQIISVNVDTSNNKDSVTNSLSHNISPTDYDYKYYAPPKVYYEDGTFTEISSLNGVRLSNMSYPESLEFDENKTIDRVEVDIENRRPTDVDFTVTVTSNIDFTESNAANHTHTV